MARRVGQVALWTAPTREDEMRVHLPKGTRDFLPDEMYRRQSVIDRVRLVFERFGFQPLETPAFERIETLTGKYGDEGQKLVFRILKRGAGGERGECDQALRYDLTVPLARVIAMNPQVRLPFKRYQIAPVWRADRPAKGRFREFLQCDADIVGSHSVMADAECVAVLHAALAELGLQRFTIRLNDRRVLAATAAAVGAADREAELLIAVDKLDKIGRDGVAKELGERGFDDAQISGLWALLTREETDEATLAHLDEALAARTTGEVADAAKAGVQALRELLDIAGALGVDASRICVDPTLARGLDYYTGPVFEVVADDVQIGSIASGGRYDGLVGMFSGREVPAVGCSLGLDRILVVLEELGLLTAPGNAIEALVTVWDEGSRQASVEAAATLRGAGVRTELYLGDGKLKHQLKYADAKGYPWLLVLGPSEIEQGRVSLRDMRSGAQHVVTLPEAVALLRPGTGPA